MTRWEPVSVRVVCGEPLSEVVWEICGEKGWGYSFVVRYPDRGRLSHRAACGHVAAIVDGLVVLHDCGEPVAPDVDDLRRRAEWLGVTVRTVCV